MQNSPLSGYLYVCNDIMRRCTFAERVVIWGDQDARQAPVVLTIFMALGAWRISKSRVLTRRLPAVEALDSATVLCTDKTGTLTENRMTVARLWARGTLHVVNEEPLLDSWFRRGPGSAAGCPHGSWDSFSSRGVVMSRARPEGMLSLGSSCQSTLFG